MEPIDVLKETMVLIGVEIFILLMFILVVFSTPDIASNPIATFIFGIIVGAIEGVIAICFIHYLQEW